MTRHKKARRSPEQMIEDLKAKIKEVEGRAKAKELKQNAAVKQAVACIRSLAKGKVLAKEEGDLDLARAFSAAHENVAGSLRGKGLLIPKPRGRKPSSASD